jgi:arylsulfatase A-like enzyme
MTMDIYPTVCQAAGVASPKNIDGLSFLSTLLGTDDLSPVRDLYFVRREGNEHYQGKTIDAFRRGDWKLLQDSPFAPLELYNLENDPTESTNLADTQKKTFKELAAGLRKQIQIGGRTPWQPPE